MNEIEDRQVGAVRGIGVERLLARPHAIAPLKVLRHRDVAGVACQQHDLAVAEVGLGIAVARVVAQIVVVGEEDLRDRPVLLVQVGEADQMALGQPVAQLVVARQHDPEPGPAALAEGDDDDVRLAQLVELLAPAQPALERQALGRRPEEIRPDHRFAGQLLDDDAHGLVHRAGSCRPPGGPAGSLLAAVAGQVNCGRARRATSTSIDRLSPVTMKRSARPSSAR